MGATAQSTVIRPRILLDSDRASRPALVAFSRIAESWKLSTRERQALLGISSSTYFKHVKHPEHARLSPDTLERISYVLGIYKALHILLPRNEAADGWVRRPNAAAIFNGRSALEVMLGGKVADLYVVRRYLDGERGW